MPLSNASIAGISIAVIAIVITVIILAVIYGMKSSDDNNGTFSSSGGIIDIKKDVILSVLIPTSIDRFSVLEPLLVALDHEIGNKPVEILILMDNGKRSMEDKYAELLGLAKSRNHVLLSDIEKISQGYIDSILRNQSFQTVSKIAETPYEKGEQPLLSILIPSIPSRYPLLKHLLSSLEKQIGSRSVEILVEIDNKRRSVGRKRNDLIQSARGKYLVFIDDDDEIEPDYIDCLLNEIPSNPDVILFQCDQWSDGLFTGIVYFDKDHPYKNLEGVYYRTPNHLMCFRSALAKSLPYRDMSYGEDTIWANEMKSMIQKQNKIHKILYHYKYVTKPGNHYGGQDWK